MYILSNIFLPRLKKREHSLKRLSEHDKKQSEPLQRRQLRLRRKLLRPLLQRRPNEESELDDWEVAAAEEDDDVKDSWDADSEDEGEKVASKNAAASIAKPESKTSPSPSNEGQESDSDSESESESESEESESEDEEKLCCSGSRSFEEEAGC